MPRIDVTQGDITRVDADAVVNAANTRMRGGGGVDGAIHRAGGRAILEDCIRRFPDGLAAGGAGYTTAGDLPAQYVIHTVGPNFSAGQRDRSLLESCYRNSLAVADDLGLRRVAFPLISAGVYGWPIDDAIAAAVDTVAGAMTSVETVTFVAFNDELADRLRTHQMLATPLRILAGLREAHRRGRGDLRFVPYIYATGAWRIEIGTRRAVHDQGSSPRVGDAGGILRYSSAQGTEFGSGRVTGATPVGAVADLIIASTAEENGVRSPAYGAWLDALIDACTDKRALPYAFDDEDGADGQVWRLTGGHGTVPVPPSPEFDRA
ncbi:O-acetyl-ADP-ribose deacetylase [Gordonia humi]|uniref:O-acetyl-ADP-ribose deacetylase (Regulator of RNase III) n=1 Tax=Gordonia humi TaxID=686429 RepID=A0A840EZ77_9ACTN|nr:O-acetyl-ADP-ribose deacetylase (regulator of RNase III) [Gordonia humi]